MPPRKSDQRKSDASLVTFPAIPHDDSAISQTASHTQQSVPAAAAASDKKDKDKDKDKDGVSIEDLGFPKSVISRLAKSALPPNTQIQANAILAMSKSATVFVSYLVSHANQHTVNAGKKTINPDDVFKALDDTEFSFLRESLEADLAKFMAMKNEKRTSSKKKVGAGKGDAANPTEDVEMADQTVSSSKADVSTMSASDGPRNKKARLDQDETEEEGEKEAEEQEMEAEEEEEEEEEAEEEEEDDEDEEANDDEENGERRAESGDDTQDALELKQDDEDDERDEALDGDESD
ncbi:hypothetical protein RJ55_00449 [Drechmeria coniospora]|nr:hypothetical protein RJ55_00449 [Drechmeria coniospora]